MEAWVESAQFGVAETGPAPPDPAGLFKGGFPNRIQDDSAVCIASVTKEATSLGS